MQWTGHDLLTLGFGFLPDPILKNIMAKAPFLSLDGLDGSGKSTQCRLLTDWLRTRGLAVTECADPGGTAIGDVIRGLLLGRTDCQSVPQHRHEMSLPCEALLFMASRAQLIAEVIRPALDAGRAVVCDRFLLANVVYQGHAGGLDPDELWNIGRWSSGGLEPDLSIVLDLPVEAAMSRRAGPADRVESRDMQYHACVRAGFLAEAQCRPERIKVVDGTLPVEVTHERICQEVAGVVAACVRS